MLEYDTPSSIKQVGTIPPKVEQVAANALTAIVDIVQAHDQYVALVKSSDEENKARAFAALDFSVNKARKLLGPQFQKR